MTDLEAVQAAAEKTWALADKEVFPGNVGFLLFEDRPDLAILGTNFRIEFRLQSDVLGPECERTMIRLRFVSVTTQQRPQWDLYVRGDWPQRTDRLSPPYARSLRRRLAPRKAPTGNDSCGDGIFCSDDIYIIPTIPREDLTAQIGLFALQTSLSNEPELFDWVSNYLRRSFRFNARDRQDIVHEVLCRLISNKWWSESARAWRLYVARVRLVLERQYAQYGAPEEVLDTVGKGKKRGHKRVGRIPLPPEVSIAAYDPSGTVVTVTEAAKRAGIPISTLYARIRRRSVASQYDLTGRMLVSESEVQRVIREPKLKEVIRMVAEARGCTHETARQFVYRSKTRGVSLEEILKGVCR